MTRWPMLAVAMLAACSRGTVTATVIDDLTGDPLPGVNITARAVDEVPFSCQVVEGQTDDAGVVRLPGVCLSSSSYRLRSSNPSMWFIEGDTVAAGSDGAAEVRSLFAPEGAGAYLLSSGVLSALSTHGDVKTATVQGTEEVVEFPSAIPREEDIPFIGPESWLVITGVDNAQSARLIPLVKSGPRRLMNGRDRMTQQDWWYMGVRFTSDTEFTRTAAMIDASRVRTHSGEDRAVAIIPYNAVPGGRYALKMNASERVTILDMGTTPVALTE